MESKQYLEIEMENYKEHQNRSSQQLNRRRLLHYSMKTSLAKLLVDLIQLKIHQVENLEKDKFVKHHPVFSK